MTIFLFLISIALVIIAGKNFDKTEVKGDHTVKYLLIAAAVVGFFAYNLYAEDEKERLLESSRNAHDLYEEDFNSSHNDAYYYNNGNDISFGATYNPPKSDSDGYIFSGRNVIIKGIPYKYYRKNGHGYYWDGNKYVKYD